MDWLLKTSPVTVIKKIYEHVIFLTSTRSYHNSLWPIDVTWSHRKWSSLIRAMAWLLTGAKLLPERMLTYRGYVRTLHWRDNEHDGVSYHQPHGCLLNRLFRRRSQKTSKLRVTGLCVGNSPGPVNSPHNGPVTRKMFPFDDVIMTNSSEISIYTHCFSFKECILKSYLRNVGHFVNVQVC